MSRLNFGAQHIADIFAQVFLDENAVTLRIDTLTLTVEHVVVFEQMLADVEVGTLHTALRLLHDIANDATLKRQRIVHAQALHQAANLLPSEQAHQVIFEREEETRGTGITLTGRATTQLVVDTARFVTFRANDV